MTANADRPITAEELVREISWRSDSISTAVTRLVTRYPGKMERIGKGVYRWNSSAEEATPEPVAEPEQPTEMIVKVLTEKPDRMLVQDLDSGLLYVMTQFEF
jgi:hypothetical protein